MKQENSKFKFEGYKISHSELNLSDSKSDNLEFCIGIKAKGKISEKHFLLKLDTSIASNDNSVSANVVMEGSFVFDESISKDMLNNLFCANAPAIMFPYIRAYISTLTAISGVDAVILPTLAMVPLGEEIRKSLDEDNKEVSPE
jgi:preprotein translocase subunit SecB